MSPDKEEAYPDRSRGLLYGRRKGKTLRAARARAYEDGLARHALDLSAPCTDVGSLFSVPVDGLALENGIGGGERLLHQMARQPPFGFIGCEPFVNGMARLLDDARDHQGRERLRVHEGDAREVISWLPNESLDLVYLLYPDPWPKLRHEKRRFMGTDTLGLLHPKMKLGGELRVASDIDVYKKTTEKAVRLHDGFRDSGRDISQPWEDWLRTRYEAKAVREGRQSAYYSFFRDVLPD
ncbi:MAG: tRNA (guanine(46)-N(7))-methyltransferase TrmB [Cohaesibacteraceae bacterium]